MEIQILVMKNGSWDIPEGKDFADNITTARNLFKEYSTKYEAVWARRLIGGGKFRTLNIA